MSSLLRARDLVKFYGPVRALSGVSLDVERGRVSCLLGDNGAGKSTVIKIVSGVTQPDSGTLEIDNYPTVLSSSKDALDLGIATVYQDLAVVPVLPVYRNFCMGSEPTKGRWPLRVLDVRSAIETTRQELHAIGIDLDDVRRPIATLSGGQRQCVAIARAVHQGAKVLILDEPTSALGVRQSRIVLRYIAQTKERGIGVVLVTHNPMHAYAVGDTFTILKHGAMSGHWSRDEIQLDELERQMSGGHEVKELLNIGEDASGDQPSTWTGHKR